MKLNRSIIACAVAATLIGCDQGTRQTGENTGRPDESRPSETKQNAPSATPVLAEPAAGAKLAEEKNATLAALQEKSKTAADKCEELKQSGKETWQQVKDQFNATMRDFKKAIEDAKSKFSS